jgi:hypothetical protein
MKRLYYHVMWDLYYYGAYCLGKKNKTTSYMVKEMSMVQAFLVKKISFPFYSLSKLGNNYGDSFFFFFSNNYGGSKYQKLSEFPDNKLKTKNIV